VQPFVSGVIRSELGPRFADRLGSILERPPNDGGSVANLQLMHAQAMNIGIGIGAAVIAAIFATGAAIVSSRG
jgi:hypothetical protein